MTDQGMSERAKGGWIDPEVARKVAETLIANGCCMRCLASWPCEPDEVEPMTYQQALAERDEMR